MFTPSKILPLLFVTLLVNAQGESGHLAPIHGEISEAVGDRFAITFKKPVTRSHLSEFFEHLGLKIQATTQAVCDRFHFMNADSALLEKIRSHRLVKHVEYVQEVNAYACRLLYKDATWGVARICHDRPSGSSEYFTQEKAGVGVQVYVIDSGININHTVFQGRASFDRNFVPGSPNTDQNGHGTCVAALMAKVSPGARPHAVKVLGQNGSGNTEWVTRAICYVKGIAEGTTDKVVINLSLGGPYSRNVNDAVEQANKAGIAVVAAAGNQNKNACLNSPASSVYALTVAATTSTDGQANYSNFGNCVDIQAPGSSLKCAKHTSNTGEIVSSGTSMAAPIVAGLLANVLTIYGIPKASDGYQKVKELAQKDVINPIKALTPNLLANNGCHA